MTMQTAVNEADIIEGRRFLRGAGEANCYLCGKRKESRRIPVRFGQNVIVAKCSDCRIAFQSPMPSPEASSAYMNWRWRSTDVYVRDRASQMQRAMKQVSIIKRFINRPIRLVDFGAGSGSFVRAALDQGWAAIGIELSISARSLAREFYNVELRGEMAEGQYDVITLWDVVEHLRDPRGILTMLGRYLTKDGIIFIETGNFENWRRIAEKDKWGLYLFDHQFYFSPSSLKQVLRDSGFKKFYLLDCHHSHPTIRIRKFLRQPLRFISSWFWWIWAKAKWPKHGDINVMLVVGRK